MLTGAILAGGQNRRMNGQMKAFLSFHGERLIERQIREMKTICDEIIVVTNRPELFNDIVDHGIRIITDQIPGKGPLSGMHAVFSCARYNDVWVVGCDMPFICSQAALVLHNIVYKAQCDAAIPFIEGRIHPLHGVYRRSSVEAAEAVLNSGNYRLTHFLDRINWEKADESCFVRHNLKSHFVVNVNTPEEYRNAVKGQVNDVTEQLTHFNEQNRARMVDISEKTATLRTAVAEGKVTMHPTVLKRIKQGNIGKGDVLAVAQVAGIMAAKKTAEWIPMCHPLALSSVDLTFNEISDDTINIVATVKTTGPTGVEMEALTAVSAAALTIYDMCKAADKRIVIGPIYLVRKTGGKSGDYVRGDG